MDAINETIEEKTLNALLAHYATCVRGYPECAACRIAKPYAQAVSPYKRRGRR